MREVERGALLVDGLDPGAGPQRVEALASQEPVAGNLTDVEIDTVPRLVGHAASEQFADERHHAVDVGRGVRRLVGTQDPERVHRLPPARLELDGHLGLGPPLLGRPLDDVVVDVGDVRDVGHVEAAEEQVPAQHVEDERVATVSEVGQVVDRRPAHVHGRLSLSAEVEGAHGPGRGVVEAQHPGTVTRSCRAP